MMCVEFDSVPATHLYHLDDRTAKRKLAVETANIVVQRRPVCMHFRFSRDKPFKAIMKIQDGYICQKEIQGSWWLVEGPDVYDNCLLSWAYLDPNAKRDPDLNMSHPLSTLGFTQHLRSDFNKLGFNVKGMIVQDSNDCSRENGYDVNLLLKDPRNMIHRIKYNHEAQDTAVPYWFAIKPNSTEFNEIPGDTLTDTTTSKRCTNPYCTKLLVDRIQNDLSLWNQHKSIPTTLAFIMIERVYFDPMFDPDLIA